MRRSIISLACLFLLHTGYSQKQDSCISGVYITKEDFSHNHLSHKINTGEKGTKLEFSFPADLTLAVKIITPDTTLKFEAGSIYGFNDCGKVFRYFRGGKELNAQEDYYKVEEVGGLVIYSSAFVSDEEIFYSLSYDSPIHRITMENLKDDFKNYPDFIEAAKKLSSQPGDGLATRDEKGHFKINILYHDLVKNN